MSMPPIVIDTREKKPYSFYDMNVVRRKMDTGDYSIEGFEDVFAIERKSLDDYLLSITHERDRFEREVERGSKMDEFEVVIESSESKVRAGNFRRDVAPLAAINTAKSWSRADNYAVRFVWAGGRSEAKARTLNKLQKWYGEYS